ncbi:MAG: class I SAM-dependent methyltransferase [Candidatus Promineifilaceae bacterium]|nr:class I SAM-dependent methyltransferase [Candidatus Promineifilaceae bacterium]
MVECRRCGAVYQNPRPTPERIKDFYPSAYQPYTVTPDEEGGTRQLFRRYGLGKRIDLVRRYLSTGRLLDVGCATGDFLAEMGKAPGWKAYGIEPSFAALSYGRLHAGICAVQGLLNQPPFAPAAFDVITMWDVLEHVYDPVAVVRQAALLLRPGGILVVNHPNLDSFDRQLFGDLWVGYELPRHLTLYPSDLLRSLMGDAGFEQIDRLCLYGSHAATNSSLMYVIEAKIKSKRLKRLSRAFLFGPVARIVLAPFFKVIDWLKLGPNLTVVFRKASQTNEG